MTFQTHVTDLARLDVEAAEILDSVGDVGRGSWFHEREWWITPPVNKLCDMCAS